MDNSEKQDRWVWDKKAELLKAKQENHFSQETVDNAFISGDTHYKVEVYKQKCAMLIYLCQAYDIKVEGLGEFGSYPVAFVDIRPSAPKGSPKKYGEILEKTHYPKGKPKETVVEANFDVTVWGLAAEETIGGDWRIDLDKVPEID